MSGRSERGHRGERAARRHLTRRGWRILAVRWRAAGGELDLIAARGMLVIGCEVKTRTDPAALVEPLTAAQRARMARTAMAFIALRPGLADREVRLDLITVEAGRYLARVRHLPGYAGDP